jgi:endonuclease III
MKKVDTRIHTILLALTKEYRDATIALSYSNPWELLVAVILSAQCTDVMVNKVTQQLFKKYTSLTAYADADLQEFEQDIKPTGFYKQKAKNIIATANRIRSVYGGVVPKTMEEMLTLSGVARKTANIVLGVVYTIPSGIPVDTHVLRIAQRLRLVDVALIGGKKRYTFLKNNIETLDFIKDADPNKIEQQLMTILPPEEWLTISYKIINHGRTICKAVKPQCEHCFLSVYCPSSRV